jgi:hypothetical protein
VIGGIGGGAIQDVDGVRILSGPHGVVVCVRVSLLRGWWGQAARDSMSRAQLKRSQYETCPVPLNELTSADDLTLGFWHLPFLMTPVTAMTALTVMEPVMPV